MARTTSEVDKVIQDTLLFVGEHIDVSAAILFGSYAQGTPGPYSDVDLAVFSADIAGWSVERRVNLGVMVKHLHPDVELHLFADEALKEARPSNFYGHLLATGKRVA